MHSDRWEGHHMTVWRTVCCRRPRRIYWLRGRSAVSEIIHSFVHWGMKGLIRGGACGDWRRLTMWSIALQRVWSDKSQLRRTAYGEWYTRLQLIRWIPTLSLSSGEQSQLSLSWSPSFLPPWWCCVAPQSTFENNYYYYHCFRRAGDYQGFIVVLNILFINHQRPHPNKNTQLLSL